MISNDQARIDAQLSHAAYGDAGIPAGYELAKLGDNQINLDDPLTGFHAKVYLKTGTGEYVIAFTGSQNGQDWLADTTLGTKQWTKQIKDEVIATISSLPNASKITFTGQSLGGALAQYAAYDYLNVNPSHPPVSLVTFNAIGGIAGLQNLHQTDPGGFNPTIASQLSEVANFFGVSSGRQDLVARVGGGHFGGNTYQVDLANDIEWKTAA